jgi:hypothetical protein
MRLKWLALFAMCLPSLSDNGLDSFRESLLAMRDKPIDSGGPGGAVPQLATAKHQLRDWVESRLNAELLDAKLFRGYYGVKGRPPCADWSLRGFLNELKLHRSGIFLILETGVGIECGCDE